MLSTSIINICNNIAWNHGNITVKDFRKYEKPEYKKNKLKWDIDFLNNYKQLGVYLEFLIFKLLNVSNTTLYQFVKYFFVALSTSVIKNLNIFQKNLVYPKTFYLLIFLLLTLHPYKIYIVQQEIAAEIVIYSPKKVIFNDEWLQLTYIHT